ncbi:transposon Tf2-6 polyprotein [Trichonephila clavipes]|nr:transposon Tf2-6 polyprotein [Trichonephila clavipes]
MCRTRSKQKNIAARRVNAMEGNSEISDAIYIGELKSVNEQDAKETNYVWPCLSDEGIKPNPKKVRAIEEFATPNCKENLQRFLDSVWIWDTNTERDFELAKQAIMKSPCLKYFNVKKAENIFVDASKNGLGAVLLQEDQPVAYGYVSLT